MTGTTNETSLRTAALVAGLGLLVMAVAAPFSELFVYPKLVVSGNAAETARNITANQSLFVYGILGYLVTFICDVVVAWALYVLLKPVNQNLSLLTAWFRLVYTVIALVALVNLVTALRLLNTADYLAVFGPDQLYAQVRLALGQFRNGWSFGILFFGIHLGLLGYLVIKSNYISTILGALLIVGGLGYAITTLGPFLLPSIDLHVARFTFYGELIFMLWLIIRVLEDSTATLLVRIRHNTKYLWKGHEPNQETSKSRRTHLSSPRSRCPSSPHLYSKQALRERGPIIMAGRIDEIPKQSMSVSHIEVHPTNSSSCHSFFHSARISFNSPSTSKSFGKVSLQSPRNDCGFSDDAFLPLDSAKTRFAFLIWLH